jgi:hypothetical protein
VPCGTSSAVGEYLSQGQGYPFPTYLTRGLALYARDTYKMPQPWAQTAMLCCVNALPTQVIIMLIIPVLTKGRRVGGQHGRARAPRPVPRRERKVCCPYLVSGYYVIMLMLYGGFITVNATVFIKQKSKEVRKSECFSRYTSSWRCARRSSRSVAPRRSP